MRALDAGQGRRAIRGTTAFTFTVTRTRRSSAAASTAAYALTGSGSQSRPMPADFGGATLPGGTVSFAANETSKTVTVNVAGDTAVEPDEGFTVTLSQSQQRHPHHRHGHRHHPERRRATAARAGDCGPGCQQGGGQYGHHRLHLHRHPQWRSHGRHASAAYTARGRRRPARPTPRTSAAALPSGTVSFAAGEASKQISINVSGDTAVEPDEGFTVTLANTPANATLATAAAAGTIRNDDVPTPARAGDCQPLTAVQPEGDSGPTAFTFTVTRTRRSRRPPRPWPTR
ncbi:MAG: hypothetical protein M0C28_06715 [Candidatus Moduliflexus flocculans]|nr:hypothetical protein [Candidatus Moduliflexus flocculans]